MWQTQTTSSINTLENFEVTEWENITIETFDNHFSSCKIRRDRSVTLYPHQKVVGEAVSPVLLSWTTALFKLEQVGRAHWAEALAASIYVKIRVVISVPHLMKDLINFCKARYLLQGRFISLDPIDIFDPAHSYKKSRQQKLSSSYLLEI